MKLGLSLPLAVALLLAAELAAGDEVTMRVLDDARDVDAVIRALRDERSAAVPTDEEAGSGRGRARTPAEPASGGREAGVPAGDPLTATLDREEESEGEIEDFDIPEDLEIPEPEED
jgi:hypothetical protein